MKDNKILTSGADHVTQPRDLPSIYMLCPLVAVFRVELSEQIICAIIVP